ncbi:hypothetical protein SMALA_8436 [Streptomyces malaysiensis subsp. malaysiensis]|nr:hypothetical protein SMALA_8436 [Streptomyces malaysiensis]
MVPSTTPHAATAYATTHHPDPAASTTRTPEDVADPVEAPQRQTTHGPARLAAGLQRLHGVTRAPATVHRTLVRRGLNRFRDLDPPTGEQLREAIRRYEHDRGGGLVHVDVKKLRAHPCRRRLADARRRHRARPRLHRASKRTSPGTGPPRPAASAHQPDRREQLPNRLRPAARTARGHP